MVIPFPLAVVASLCFLAGQASAQNLVPNGGFESGSTGWSGGSPVADTPHSGTACLQVVDNNPSSSVAASTDAIIAIVPGTAHVFEAWVRGSAAGQETLVTLNQYDASDAWISGNNMDFVVTAGTTWTEFRRNIRSFNGATRGVRVSLRPTLWTPGGELLGTAYFDDVMVAETTINVQVRGKWLSRGGAVEVWRSATEQKVWRDKVLPGTQVDTEISLSAARGEFEPFQIVLLPHQVDALTGVRVSSLAGPAGASIAASAISVREVAYVEVTEPTDYGSSVGWQPDPLPLLVMPLALTTDVQQPLWITIEVPTGAQAGEYVGSIDLQMQNSGTVTVLLRLRVWGFTLDATHNLQTAYGLSIGMIDRYHHLGGDPDKRRQVYRLYLEEFAAHRMSPYFPEGDDVFTVSYPNWNWSGATLVCDPETSCANRVVQVEDTRIDAAVSARTGEAIPVNQGTSYVLSWRARTQGASDYLVAVNQLDSADAQIPGNNVDLVRSGDGTWLSESARIDASIVNTNAVAWRISLYARPWTPGGENTGTTLFDDIVLVEEGTSTNLVANGDFDLAAAAVEVALDTSRFDPAMSYALDYLGFDSFRLRIPGFASGWGFGTGPSTTDLLGFPWGSPEYETIMRTELRAIADHLALNGWLDAAYVYWFDEPRAGDYPFVVQGMQLIASADPRLRRLLTEQAEPELTGYVDIWTPILDQYDTTWAWQRQAAGDEVWWYVCTGPRAPYPNNFIDHPGIEHRVRFWMAWDYGVEGSLLWNTNYWTNDSVFAPPNFQDPWVNPQSYNYSSGTVGTWGNGDGRLFYPPRGWADGQERIEGPTPSLRWELLREGIEDYEYFARLAQAADALDAAGETQMATAARALLDVPSSIYTSMTEYDDDPALLRTYRELVGNALEQAVAALVVPAPDGGGGDPDRRGDGATGDSLAVRGDGGTASGDDGTVSGGDGDLSPPPQGVGQGCGCTASSSAQGWLLVALGFLLMRRRHGPLGHGSGASPASRASLED